MKNPKVTVAVCTLIAFVATFAYVEYVGDNRRFSADVNLVASIFSFLVGALVFSVSSRFVKKQITRQGNDIK